MQILVEKRFELWENRTHTDHDSPTIGVSETFVTSQNKLGSYTTRAGAQRTKRLLIDKYLAEGWKLSRESTKDTAVLYEDTMTERIVVWIEEEVISEQRIPRRG